MTGFKRLLKSEAIVLYALLLPSLVGIFIFYTIPFIFSLVFAMVDNNVSMHFVGLKNVMELFQSEAFLLRYCCIGCRKRTAGSSPPFFGAPCDSIRLYDLFLAKAHGVKRCDEWGFFS